jgi:acetophenone carboxylase
VLGISVRKADLIQRFADGDQRVKMDLSDILENKTIEGQFTTEFQGRALRPYENGDVVTIGFSTGGTGYGDPLDRDPESLKDDLDKAVISAWAVKHVYKVAWDPERRRVDVEATKKMRTEEYQARLRRGRPYDEFESEWLTKKPPDQILGFYGTWPDAKQVQPVMRP